MEETVSLGKWGGVSMCGADTETGGQLYDKILGR